MGKTNRKVKWYAGEIRESYIDNRIRNDYNRNIRHGFIWVKRSKEERHAEYLEREIWYDREMVEYKLKMEIAHQRLAFLKENYGKNPDLICKVYYGVEFPVKPYIHISKTKKVPFEDDYDTFFKKRYEEESRRYDKMLRDGKPTETSRSSGFKTEAKRQRRRHDKEILLKILKDEESYYDSCFYGNKDSKKLIWNWW